MGVLKLYPTQRQALEEILDAGDDMARTIEASATNTPAFWASQQGHAVTDWRNLRKRYERIIDRLKNR